MQKIPYNNDDTCVTETGRYYSQTKGVLLERKTKKYINVIPFFQFVKNVKEIGNTKIQYWHHLRKIQKVVISHIILNRWKISVVQLNSS